MTSPPTGLFDSRTKATIDKVQRTGLPHLANSNHAVWYCNIVYPKWCPMFMAPIHDFATYWLIPIHEQTRPSTKYKETGPPLLACRIAGTYPGESFSTMHRLHMGCFQASVSFGCPYFDGGMGSFKQVIIHGKRFPLKVLAWAVLSLSRERLWSTVL
jgi:hypothetical protein